MKARKLTLKHNESGSTLLWVMGTVLILSIAGATVLSNATTRYNVTSKQVKGWQDALGAAEAGADLGFAEVRLHGLDSTKGFASADGWASPAPSPLPATNSWNQGYTTTPPTFGDGNSLSAKVTVDRFAMLPGSTTVGYYRIRSAGTAQVRGLKRTGMDDALEGSGTNFTNEKPRGKGDSLLRKIDFKLDHFIATYGYGDALPSAPATTANGKTAVPIADSDFAQVTRRVELIAIPIMPIEAGVKTGTFRGTTVDSYDSNNLPKAGTNPPSSYYGSSPTGSEAIYANDAQDGDVACATSDFYVQTMVYGDVSTNGGNATKAKVTGVVDNNVTFTLPPAVPGTAPIPNLPGPNPENQSSGDINPPNRDEIIGGVATGKKQSVFWYTYPSLGGIRISPNKATVPGVSGQQPIDTTINIYVNNPLTGGGDVDTRTSLTNLIVEKGVTANIYFRGNLYARVSSIDNQNGDGPGGNGVYVRNYNYNPITQQYTQDVGTPFSPSPNVSRAGHLWFWGISPPAGSSRVIDLKPGGAGVGAMWAAFYAPGHDCSTVGNPELYGVMVSKSFYQNGGNAFHFDKQLLTAGSPIDYRVASYIEDIR